MQTYKHTEYVYTQCQYVHANTYFILIHININTCLLRFIYCSCFCCFTTQVTIPSNDNALM